MVCNAANSSSMLTLNRVAPFALALTYIHRICEEPTKADAIFAFQELKSTLLEQYDQTLQRIQQSGARAKIALRTSAWLLQAKVFA
jgi:hypothetical protein